MVCEEFFAAVLFVERFGSRFVHFLLSFDGGLAEAVVVAELKFGVYSLNDKTPVVLVAMPLLGDFIQFFHYFFLETDLTVVDAAVCVHRC